MDDTPTTPPSLRAAARSSLRAGRLLAAALLSLTAVVYGATWSLHTVIGYDVLSDWLGMGRNALAARTVELNLDIEYSPERQGVVVTEVRDGPASAAGLAAGDLIVAVDGRSLRDSAAALGQTYLRARPGDAVEFEVLPSRDGGPVSRRAVFRERSVDASAALGLLLRTTAAFPFVLLAVALPVLFYRLEDRNAWLLALVFVGLIAVPEQPDGVASLSPPVRTALNGYQAVFGNLTWAFFYTFFAVFPARSPLDRRAPWLKAALFCAGGMIALSGLLSAHQSNEVTRAFGPSRALQSLAGALASVYGYVGIALGLLSVSWNARQPETADARRRIGVIVWGTALGIVPAVVYKVLSDLGAGVSQWGGTLVLLLLFLFPLSFGYAVLRYRVLEIPLLLKRSARYLLVRRGFVVLLVLLALAANATFAFAFSRWFEADARLATSAGVGFGLLLASIAAPGVRSVTRMIDRGFFREAYDARLILEHLAQEIRGAADGRELAALLQRQLKAALRPTTLTLYSADAGVLRALAEDAAPLPLDSPGLAELTRDGRAADFLGDGGRPLVPALAPRAPECIVPIAARDRLLGLVSLGPRLSEEPYSGEDRRLLTAVAAQAAVALENLELAARIAERLEAERRAAHEMELARRVQRRLLPEAAQPLRTLECTGRCVQARAVGGDYFDFLALAEGKTGLVLADVSGKGLSAALLMASLQASLRTATLLPDGLGGRLAAVNRLLVGASESNRYATLFMAEYDDAGGRLEYANCGHNPPLVVRADGVVERLLPTAMVVGLVEDWSCEPSCTTLRPGDVLVVYSDGLSEAANETGDEFGEARLAAVVRASAGAPLEQVADSVYDAVRAFSRGEQADDQTLVLARAVRPGCRS